ncbi:MAG: hypothetical protein H6Q73_898 [Firmicutes bacterium]|nr:hypothetical protein [Bacillota bacterium]
MAKWYCAGCDEEMETEWDYEPKYCCNGYMCACQAKPINPIFCDKCVEQMKGAVSDG